MPRDVLHNLVLELGQIRVAWPEL